MQGSCGRFPKWGNLHRCYKWRHVFWPRAAAWYLVFLSPSSRLSAYLGCICCTGDVLPSFSTQLKKRGTQLVTGTHLNPEHSVSAAPKTGNSQGISAETLFLLASCILPPQGLSTSKSEQVQKDRGLWQLPGKSKAVWLCKALMRVWENAWTCIYKKSL